MSIKEILAAGAVKAAETVAEELITEVGPAVGSYIGTRLRQIIRANGTKFMPDQFGAFVPKSAEERDLCEYYKSIDLLSVVEK